ncbi:hypothetical protein F2P79_015690 [Pimephales promelas]|nr:hypothetical protein F2P79_015690 [Pimephales promelas]
MQSGNILLASTKPRLAKHRNVIRHFTPESCGGMLYTTPSNAWHCRSRTDPKPALLNGNPKPELSERESI